MWTGAEAYDQLMGRWSRQLSPALIGFATVEGGDRVLDVGCGTGSLTRALLAHGSQLEVVGVDAAGPYVEYGRRQLTSTRASLQEADAQNLPLPRCVATIPG